MLNASKNNNFHSSLSKRIATLLIGMTYGIFYYYLFQLSRDIFRYYSIYLEGVIWDFSKTAIEFYNIIFAFVALLLGQSAALAFYFSGPKKYGEYKYFRRIGIVHDQRGLSFYFLHWFSSLATIYGIWSAIAFQDSQLYLSLFPKYSYLFVLIIMVLFLHSWKTIRLKFKRKSLKWMLYSFTMISVLAILISRIQHVPIKRWKSLEKYTNIRSTAPKSLPKRNLDFKISNFQIKNTLHISSQNIDSITFENKSCKLEELGIQIAKYEEYYSDYSNNNRYKYYRVLIDSTVQMNRVLALDSIISLYSKDKRIVYAFRPNYKTYNLDFGLLSNLIDYQKLEKDLIARKDFIEKSKNSISFFLDRDGQLSIDNQFISMKDLKTELNRRMRDTVHHLIQFRYNDEVPYSKYLDIRILLKQQIDQLKSDLSKLYFAKEYEKLNQEERKNLHLKNPIGYIEIPQSQENQYSFLKE